MQTLPSDILTLISQYLSLRDVLELTGMNKRSYQLKDRLIQSHIDYQAKLWVEASLTLLTNIKDSMNGRKSTLLKMIKLGFYYRIFILKWKDIDEKLKEKLLAWYPIDLYLHLGTILQILYHMYYSVDRCISGELIPPKPPPNESNISAFIFCFKFYYRWLQTCYSSIITYNIGRSGLNIFKYRGLSYFYNFIKLESLNEKQWSWYFKQDLKHNWGPLGYFKTRQEVIDFYKDRPLRKNLLYNITKRHKK